MEQLLVLKFSRILCIGCEASRSPQRSEKQQAEIKMIWTIHAKPLLLTILIA
jgi:hypothetical protein